MASVTLSGIRKSYGSVDVIKGVDLSIDDGKFVVFVGPSGCGKSTLLRMIAGLEDISAGTLRIGNQTVNDLPPKERRVAMVFQSYAIFPHMTVRENVEFGLTIAGASKAEKDAKVAEAARILQMEHLLDRRPSQLSGGQRQRVAIGRAIVRKPAVFLFDEPLSNLDAALRVDMRMELTKLHGDLKATMIYVTHDQVEAMTLADKIVVLNAGTVQQVGTPLDLYHRPDNLFVAGFIGSPKMNFIDVTVERADGHSAIVSSADTGPIAGRVRSSVSAGQKLKLGVRPHHLTLAPDGPINGRIRLIERLGHETISNVTLTSGLEIVAAFPGDVALEIGQHATLSPGPDEVHLFTEAGTAA
jgi:multiple sugar transport system ATP-binding protein